jgi:hypothetical protein
LVYCVSLEKIASSIGSKNEGKQRVFNSTRVSFLFTSYLQKTKKDSARASNTVKEELRKTKTSLAFYKSQIEVFTG